MTTPLEGTSITSDLPDASSPPEWCLFCSPGGGSSHLIHSQLLLRSAVSDSDLIACRSVCPQTPTCFSRLMVEVPAKPLQPSPTAKTFHPWSRSFWIFQPSDMDSWSLFTLGFTGLQPGWTGATRRYIFSFSFSGSTYMSCCPGVETR